MNLPPFHRRLTALALGAILLVTASFPAFAMEEEEEAYQSQFLIRTLLSLAVNPDLPVKIYEDKYSGGSQALLRYVGDYYTPRFAAEINLYAAQRTFSTPVVSAGLGGAVDVERSSTLTLYDGHTRSSMAELAVDRLNATLTAGPFDLTVGRQPINLATCYYFTPNDFFAPFAAQTFYRVYKPGVDAARLNLSLGELSQVTLYGVLGYAYDPLSSNGWSEEPEADRSSYLARYSFVVANIDIALLAGSVARDQVAGIGVQGDLPFWDLGFRLEGHYRAFHEENRLPGSDESTVELVAQLVKRFTGDLEIQLEYFHHGAGATDQEEYLPGASGFYLARRYAALGGSLQLTPLFTVSAVGLVNLVDYSASLSAYGSLSVANNVDMAISIGYPVGERDLPLSEYGAYPASASIELNAYF